MPREANSIAYNSLHNSEPEISILVLDDHDHVYICQRKVTRGLFKINTE